MGLQSAYKFWRAGNSYYILDLQNDILKKFDTFGNCQGNGLKHTVNDSVQDVFVLSILKSTKDKTELFCDGKKLLLNEPYIPVVSKVRRMGNYIGTMFMNNTTIDGEAVSQVIFCYNKEIALKTIFKELKLENWLPV